MLSELAPHLPLELDFEHEAQNAARCAAFFSATGGGAALAGRVVVPEARRGLPAHAGLAIPRDPARSRDTVSGVSSHLVAQVHASLSTARVLTMSFEEGVSVTDVQGVTRLGLAPHAVARQLSEAFCARTPCLSSPPARRPMPALTDCF